MNIGIPSIPASPVSQTGGSLVPALQLDISHYVIEELVTVPTPLDNAPHAQSATPARSGLLARTSRLIFGDTGPRQQEESNVTERRRAVDFDAVPAVSSEEQQLLQLQIIATTDDRVRLQMEMELDEVDARRATLKAALASSHPQTPTGERESAGSLGASPTPSPPHERCSPRRSPSPRSEVAALMQLFQLQMQQAADREQRYEEQRREDRREAAELRREAAEREARLEARLLRTPTTTAGAYRIGAAAKEFRPFEGK